jgi:hypothetical protein
MIGWHATNRVETAHNSTVTHAEPVIGPAEDTAIFFQPRGMVFVTWLWVIAVIWAVCRGLAVLVLLPFGVRPTAADIVPIAESLLIVPAVGAGLCMLAAWQRLGWLHSSMHGLEFAATGRKAVSMPWSAVASVALRRRGVFTELVVTPTAPDAVMVVPGRGRRPRMSGDAYVVDVGLMSPGPAVLLAELHRRIPSRV